MTGESAKTRANRANALRSTGPTSLAGKARSAQNAVRHGLATPVRLDPLFGPKVLALAGAIAGSDASDERLAAAALIAEAHIDLVRIRQRRVELFQRELIPRGTRRDRQEGYYHFRMRDGVVIENVRLQIGPVDRWDAAEYFRPALTRLERYERRALSRRRAAMAAFEMKFDLQPTAAP